MNDFLKNNKKIIFLIVLSVIFLVSMTILAVIKEEPKIIGTACFDEKQNCFSVEYATTESQWGKGLMYRKNLEENKGMIFIFDTEDVHPFWMKNTLIPLDIIWLDSDGKIVFIKENAQPCGKGDCPLIKPEVPAKYVLEIKASLAQKNNMELGDIMELTYPNHK